MTDRLEPFVHLGEYSSEENAAYERLLQQSIEKLPFTLSYPIEKWKEHIRRGDYDRAMNYLLDFFETGVQYLSCVLLALMRKGGEAGVEHEALARIVDKIDHKRPLSFGDWVNDIFIPLANTAIIRIPDNPLAVSLGVHVVNRKSNLLLGNNKNISSIVQIRNEYRGHATVLSGAFYQQLNRNLESRVYKMLEGMAPLQDWEFFSCREQKGDGTYGINRLNGSQSGITETVHSAIPLEPFHYYIRQAPEDPVGELTDVFPLVFCNESGHVYVIQTLREDSVSYVSSHEDAPAHNEKRWNGALDGYLQVFQPAFDVSRELNWTQIRELAAEASNRFIANAYREKKYNRELFVDRSRLTAFFEDFKVSDKTLFPLLGEAGQGKTNQLCYWTETLLEQEKAVLIFNSSGFSEATLEEQLKNTFGYSPRRPVRRLLDTLHEKALAAGQQIYIFLDAMNECLSYKGSENGSGEAPLLLYRDICTLLTGGEYPCFKVLFTCRSYTWKNLIQPQVGEEDTFTFHVADEEQIAVRGFTDRELEQAYGIYRELYQMETDFENLGKSPRIRLKDPLALKIACTNYLGAELPGSTLPYSSISLFGKMFTDISRSYAGKGQCRILKELASYILQEYEKGVPADSIPVSALREAYDREELPLHRMSRLVYKKDGVSVAYAELLNKPERPVLRLVEEEDGEGRIQFIYERFLEYMLALVFTERETEKLARLDSPIPTGAYAGELHRSGSNVVFMGAMRNALILDYQRTGDHSVMLDLVRKHGDDFEVMLLVTETIHVLTRENYEEALFGLMDRLLGQQLAGEEELVKRFNAVNKKIASNQADDTVIAEHNELAGQLAPIIRLRKLASVSTINGIFLTDFFNEDLYRDDPFRLLWQLMTDPVDDVSNDACLYVYYLSNKTHTLEYARLRENLTERIVREMFAILERTAVPKIIVSKSVRSRSLVFLETAIRIATLLIIDASMSQKADKGDRIVALLGEIKAVLKHFTWNFRLIRLMMPLFSTVLRKQLTFQSTYVNNIIEYQTFWDGSALPTEKSGNGWSRESLKEVMPFVFHYGKYFRDGAPGQDVEIPDFTPYQEPVLAAYALGDSFSYFTLERLLVIMGTCSWEYVRPIVTGFFTEEYRRGEWFDYSQMSMLYVLFQLAVHAPEQNDEIVAIYSRECADWTRRCRGQFRGRNSHKANPTKHYKRNVMNWYCVVYCRHTGDAVPHPGDERCVPVFYELIDEAFASDDKELLYHLIDNISELITDYGYISTALGLLKYILLQLDSTEKIERFDRVRSDRTGIYQDDLITLIGRVLGTAKNYFPVETDNFMKKDMVGLKFPGASRYREEILNYNPSGESLSDLFTHKFGNFLMWSLLHEEAVDRFAYEAMTLSADSKDFFKWFDQVIRLLFLRMFGVKL